MQVLTIVCVAALVWFGWGYSMAFTSTGTPWPTVVGGLDKAFLANVDVTTLAATFSNGVYLPELVFVMFQMTFACITPALIVGAFAERVKFTPLILFVVGWLTLAYFPIAHMVWYWAGPDFLPTAPTDMGYLWGMGALDFAGGTVVHINAGIAGLIGCLVIGPRIGHNSEAMPPHSLVMTMIGASLLWIGWFGFNAGSALESNAFAALAFINTFVATAAAGATWAIIEQIVHKKPSLLGVASGVVAGLVAITPAAGFAHPGTAIILGAVASLGCYFFVATVKTKLKYDDTLDVFGIHCRWRHHRRDRHRHRCRSVARRPGLDRLHRSRGKGRRVRHGRPGDHPDQGGLAPRSCGPAWYRPRCSCFSSTPLACVLRPTKSSRVSTSPATASGPTICKARVQQFGGAGFPPLLPPPRHPMFLLRTHNSMGRSFTASALFSCAAFCYTLLQIR